MANLEDQELRLVVSIDDQATASLEKLKNQLRELGRGPADDGLRKLHERTKEVTGGVKGLEESMKGLATRAGFVGGVVGGITTELFKMGNELVSRATDLEKFTTGVVKLQQAARAAGTSSAELLAFQRAYTGVGASIESANQELTEFSRKMSDLQSVTGTFRREVLRGVDLDAQRAQELLARLDQARGNTLAQAEIIRRRGEQIYEHYRRTQTAQVAAAEQAKFLHQFNLDTLGKVEHKIREISALEAQLVAAREAPAKVFREQSEAIATDWDRTSKSLSSITLELYQATGAANAWQKTMEGIRGVFEDLEKSLINPNTPEMRERSERLRGLVPGGTELTPEQTRRLQDRMRPRRGGNLPQDPQFFGPMPFGAEMQGPRSSVWDLSGGYSQNVEDRRGETLATQDNTSALEELTGTLKQLTTPFGFADTSVATQMGGLAPGLGRGGGIVGGRGAPMGALPGLGGAPGRPPYGSSVGPGTGPGAGHTPAGPGGTSGPGPASSPVGTGGAAATTAAGVDPITGAPLNAYGGAGGGQAGFLTQHRAGIMAELQDPGKRERFMRLVASEVGNQGPQAQEAFIQSTIDRWAARGQTFEQGIANLNAQGRYERYFPRAQQGTAPSAALRDAFPGMMERTTQGQAIFPGATGNASDQPGNMVLSGHRRRGEVAGEIRGEGFINEPHARDRAFRERLAAATRGNAPPAAGGVAPAAGGPPPGLVSPVTGSFGEVGGGHEYGAGRGGGRAHSGVDWRAENNTDAVAMIGGTVQYAGWNQGYQGNVVVKGDDGVYRRYAMHGDTLVRAGQRVEQGQALGKIARRHLHYEEIPPTINGRPNPVYQQMERSPGEFVSTSGQRGTRSPQMSLGMPIGTKVTAGTPLGGGAAVPTTAGTDAGGLGWVDKSGRRHGYPPGHLLNPIGPKLDAGSSGAALDKGQNVSVTGDGTIKVDVNAPAGTNVSAEGGGLFKKTEISRNVQMEKSESGPKGSANQDWEE